MDWRGLAGGETTPRVEDVVSACGFENMAATVGDISGRSRFGFAQEVLERGEHLFGWNESVS